MISRRTSPSIGRRLFLVGFLICRNTSGRGHHSSSSRWRQTRNKRKKALPVRKLLELERAQQKVRSLNSRQWETANVVRVPRHRQHPQRAQQLRTEIPVAARLLLPRPRQRRPWTKHFAVGRGPAAAADNGGRIDGFGRVRQSGRQRLRFLQREKGNSPSTPSSSPYEAPYIWPVKRCIETAIRNGMDLYAILLKKSGGSKSGERFVFGHPKGKLQHRW